MPFVIICLATLGYIAVGSFLYGIACGVDKSVPFADDGYKPFIMAWPIFLLIIAGNALVTFGVWIGRRLF